MINSCVKLEPLTQQSRILRKGLIQASLETLRELWELKCKSDSTHKAIHTLPLGNWQAKVIVSEWIRCHSLDTIPPNGIKVAQCTLLLHQRDIPTLVKLGAWKHSPLRPSLLKSGFFLENEISSVSLHDSDLQGDSVPSPTKEMLVCFCRGN